MEILQSRRADDGGATLAQDKLFQRLVVIQRSVASGTAGPGTVAAWNALREGVAGLVADLSAAPVTVSRADGERRIRAWIGRFADRHWPAATLH